VLRARDAEATDALVAGGAGAPALAARGLEAPALADAALTATALAESAGAALARDGTAVAVALLGVELYSVSSTRPGIVQIGWAVFRQMLRHTSSTV